MGLLKVGELGYTSQPGIYLEGSSGDHPQGRWEEGKMGRRKKPRKESSCEDKEAWAEAFRATR